MKVFVPGLAAIQLKGKAADRVPSVLTDPWPGFLDDIDRDPAKAMTGFYEFTARLLYALPPAGYNELAIQDREDFCENLVLHCIDDGFHVLKTYENRGLPFAVWLRRLARNRVVDKLRRLNPDPDPESLPGEKNGRAHRGGSPQQHSDNSSQNVERRRVLEAVRHCIRQMDGHCRTLLELAADEFLPREMVLVLSWPANRAKKVSDDLRFCRKKLLNMLEGQGVRLELGG